MTLPTTMQAVTAPTPGGPDALVIGEHAVPSPGPAEILIKVAAAGVNRPDCFQRAGMYPPPPGAPDIFGLEVAGEVVALGEGASLHGVGDKVMALVPGGGYGEYCVAAETNALPVPAGLSMEEAAAIPETFFTVWSNLFDRAGLVAGEWLLVHGGSSGIGTTAIQLAKAFGASVIVTAGSADKCEACVALGADVAINYRDSDFVAEVKTHTIKGVDVILDMVGGEYVERNWHAAAVEGRIVQLATLQGKSTADFSVLMRKRLVHTGSTLRPRSVAFKAEIARALTQKVLPMVEAGAVRPVMDRTFALSEVSAAHAHMEGSSHIGKIVLLP
ncbi:NAD(P)H-quinone oxidoreductase [Acuticoccus sp. MNP-M23]|uniref:NAD(P)H-quinone oxidoreductase n=1 Tax=Acuticoccus sp. MNP-M23 TaxID=3072793 RepID=UPI002816443E|nr:NAD(P)H-quinone oxidoreductase [Acuticoccus sp. MNP-M23]WMS43200.1 NAD(P)H-quinone oxidoreductase [Acuticoccus sp. MNP-M23]